MAELGLAILWPRFLAIVLWLLMIFGYYELAKDEERRMLRVHKETYDPYMNDTVLFLPLRGERTENRRSPARSGKDCGRVAMTTQRITVF